MASKLLEWWQKAKKPLEVAVVSALIIGFVVLVILIVLGYIFNWSWTGLGPYNPPSKDSSLQRGKTLWDWMQLLIIPAVLAVGGYVFTYTTSRNDRAAIERRTKDEREAAEKSAQAERDIALDNQREAALQEYIDKMSELLLHENLRESTEDKEVRKIARVRTLTILPRLDPNRKGSVVQFLQESGLINKGKHIIDLSGADLSEANLSKADLSEADLSEANLVKANLFLANLINADLSNAKLKGANLQGADLDNTDLSNANLKGANLGYTLLKDVNLEGANLKDAIIEIEGFDQVILIGATMPDGSTHP